MKILVLAPRLPHAQAGSGHTIVHQRVRHLAERGHQIGLAAFARPDDALHLLSLRPLLAELELLPLPPRPAPPFRLLDALLTGAPGEVARHRSIRMQQCVGDMVERGRYEVVLAEYTLMGQYLHGNPWLPAVRKVLSVHRSYTLAARKELALLPSLARAVCEGLWLPRLQRFEFDLYRGADRILVLTPEERYGLMGLAPNLNIVALPSGVDADHFRPGDPAAREEALLFTGFYADAWNVDAVLWFAHRVWPRLKARRPALTFYVVGPDPPAALRDLQRRDPSIVVTGAVPDVRAYLARARVFVCPARMGTGLRGKLLEAMASGVPVVTTTLGAEGIPVQMGDTGFLADTDAIMAGYIHLLLDDPALHAAIARNARSLVADQFTWTRGIDRLEHLLHHVRE